MARLDRLGQATKEIAQIAAAIGREFPYELLTPVAERGEAELQRGLGRLAEAGLVFSRGAPPHATYLFKHALVRDAAYGSLLRRRREELHARIATVLEAEFAEAVAAEPELLAHHLTEAGRLDKAVSWWQRAGERATERSANREAISHLKRGLKILGRLPESSRRDEQELFLHGALLAPLGASEGYASAVLEQAAKTVVELGGRIASESPARHPAVLAHNYLALVHLHRGEPRRGLTIAEEALGLAKRLGDRVCLGQIHYRVAELAFDLGDLAAARRHFEQALAFHDPEQDRAEAARLGYDSGMACRSWLAIILCHQGFSDQALQLAEEAIAAARTVLHPLSDVWALVFAAYIHQWRGEVPLCRERAEAAFALASEQVLSFWSLNATVPSGWALVKEGRAEEGLARLRSGLDAFRAMGARMAHLFSLPLFLEACLLAGRIEEGLSAASDAPAEVRETGFGISEEELNRLEGELLLAAEKRDETRAEASFRKAIAIARAREARYFELRAATSLAHLLARQGRREDARALLAPIYSWFTEGFATKDLKEAKALLDELTDGA
jgi:predicted ATPase